MMSTVYKENTSFVKIKKNINIILVFVYRHGVLIVFFTFFLMIFQKHSDASERFYERCLNNCQRVSFPTVQCI